MNQKGINCCPPKVVAVAVLNDIKVEANKELMTIENEPTKKARLKKFTELAKSVKPGSNGIHRYRFEQEDDVYGIMSCEPGIKAVLQKENKINLLILVVSYLSMGLRNYSTNSIDEKSAFKKLFIDKMSLEEALDTFVEFKNDCIKQSYSGIYTDVGNNGQRRAEGEQVNINQPISGLEYFLQEMIAFGKSKQGQNYTIDKVRLVLAPYDSDRMKDGSRTPKAYIAERNQIATTIALSTVQAAIGDKQEDDNQKKLRIYIDSNGGIRDIMTAIIAAIRLMSAKNIKPTGIIVSEYDRWNDTLKQPFRITDNQNIYDIFDLVSGLDEFVKYGRADRLTKFYSGDTLFNEIENMSGAFLTCNTQQMLEEVKEVVRFLRSEKDGISSKNNVLEMNGRIEESGDAMKNVVAGNKDIMRGYIVGEIRNDFREFEQISSQDNSLENYLIPLIRWCINKSLFQQALTLYAEKMPELFVKKRVMFFKTFREPASGKRASIFEEITKIKKEYLSEEYTFIHLYLLSKPSTDKRYYKNRGFNFEETHPEWNLKNDDDQSWNQYIELLVEKGIAEALDVPVRLLTNWKENNGKDIASVLFQYFKLKKIRNDMNHANGKDISRDKLRKDVLIYLDRIEALLKREKSTNYSESDLR